MTAAVLANGTQIGFDDASDSPWVFAAVTEVLSIGAIGYATETVDVTNLDSTSKENIAGLSDGVSFSIEMNWLNDTAQTALRTAAAAGTTLQFLVAWSDSPQTKVSFAATLEGFELGAESGAQITCTVNVKISGTLDWATTGSIA